MNTEELIKIRLEELSLFSMSADRRIRMHELHLLLEKIRSKNNATDSRTDAK